MRARPQPRHGPDADPARTLTPRSTPPPPRAAPRSWHRVPTAYPSRTARVQPRPERGGHATRGHGGCEEGVPGVRRMCRSPEGLRRVPAPCPRAPATYPGKRRTGHAESSSGRPGAVDRERRTKTYGNVARLHTETHGEIRRGRGPPARKARLAGPLRPVSQGPLVSCDGPHEGPVGIRSRNGQPA